MTAVTASNAPHITFRIETERHFRRRRAALIAGLVATHATAAAAAVLVMGWAA